jgi:hypothetical protein
LRDAAYPDIVLCGILVNQMIQEYDVCITGVRGPFLVVSMEEEPPEEIGIHMDEPLWALPYIYDGTCHLYAMYAGDNLPKDEAEERDRLIREMSRYGISFNGIKLMN